MCGWGILGGSAETPKGGSSPPTPPALTHPRSRSKFDLYTKQEELPDVQQLRGYYQSLIDKYCPGQLCW